MKKILVPLAIDKSAGTFPKHFVRQTYIEKLSKRNLIPLCVSCILPEEQLDELYNLCDGVLFTGGSDFDPHIYNQEPHEKTEVLEPERDKAELYILKKILHDKKPFLGICRGSQGLAIAAGGALIQHIPDTTDKTHDVSTYDDLINNPIHWITIASESVLHKVLQKDTTEVNSGHHQAIDKESIAYNEYIKAVAFSDEGIVEAIEAKDESHFCFGIQCHPEALAKSDLDTLFDAFSKALH